MKAEALRWFRSLRYAQQRLLLRGKTDEADAKTRPLYFDGLAANSFALATPAEGMDLVINQHRERAYRATR